MMRCFCLWQKRCACGTMCAFGTFWIAGRVRKRSVYAQQPRIRANALHLTLCVRLLAMSAAFDFRKCKRLLLSSLAVYAQHFVASNNATHSCDKSHNRWLCPLRSISANASACFSLRLRAAAKNDAPCRFLNALVRIPLT